jgi:hypothetical protein
MGRESARCLDNHRQAEAGVFAGGGLLGLANGSFGLGDKWRLDAS